MKYIYTFLAGAGLALALVNITSYKNMSQTQKDIYQMQRVCKASYQIVNGKLENSCGDLIDRVETHGFMVLNDNKGNFWVEM